MLSLSALPLGQCPRIYKAHKTEWAARDPAFGKSYNDCFSSESHFICGFSLEIMKRS